MINQKIVGLLFRVCPEIRRFRSTSSLLSQTSWLDLMQLSNTFVGNYNKVWSGPEFIWNAFIFKKIAENFLDIFLSFEIRKEISIIKGASM